jgi:hypothetical protein
MIQLLSAFYVASAVLGFQGGVKTDSVVSAVNGTGTVHREGLTAPLSLQVGMRIYAGDRIVLVGGSNTSFRGADFKLHVFEAGSHIVGSVEARKPRLGGRPVVPPKPSPRRDEQMSSLAAIRAYWWDGTVEEEALVTEDVAGSVEARKPRLGGRPIVPPKPSPRWEDQMSSLATIRPDWWEGIAEGASPTHKTSPKVDPIEAWARLGSNNREGVGEHLVMASVHAQNRDWKLALESLQAVPLDQVTIPILIDKGDLWVALGDYQRAESTYAEAASAAMANNDKPMEAIARQSLTVVRMASGKQIWRKDWDKTGRLFRDLGDGIWPIDPGELLGPLNPASTSLRIQRETRVRGAQRIGG